MTWGISSIGVIHETPFRIQTVARGYPSEIQSNGGTLKTKIPILIFCLIWLSAAPLRATCPCPTGSDFADAIGEWSNGQISVTDLVTIANLLVTCVPTPEITAPQPGGALPDGPVTFEWTDCEVEVDDFQLWAGSIPGGNDLHHSGSLGVVLSHTFITPPTDGSTFYVRLRALIAGDWQESDFEFIAYNLACEFDTDNDRLPDCVETNTGVFVDLNDTGTDPMSGDTDGDEIRDGDEVLGTLDGLDLPALGTNPLVENILIEFDWFDEALECGPHSHRPTDIMAQRLYQAFAAAPRLNPDGSTGIDLILDYGQGGPFTGGNLIPDEDGVLAGNTGGEFQIHKSVHFEDNRRGYFHYCILPHRYNTNSTSSGVAEFPGDDLIVSLFCSGSDTNVSNTIMHELGHNLSLHHGGDVSCNYKPNYNSVLNYLYTFSGVDNDCTLGSNGVLDYSRGERNTLDENSLNEHEGICNDVPVDWNFDSLIEANVVFDINTLGNASCGGTLTTLRDHDDWANISFSGLETLREPIEIIECDNPPPQ